jgi:hypothetical protein
MLSERFPPNIACKGELQNRALMLVMMVERTTCIYILNPK